MIPIQVRRFRNWSLLSVGLPAVAFVVFLAVGPAILGIRDFFDLSWVPYGVCLALLGVACGLVVWMGRRLKKKATDNGNLLCFTCGYCLIGASDTCPECGVAFDREEVIRFWQEWDPRYGPSRKEMEAIPLRKIRTWGWLLAGVASVLILVTPVVAPWITKDFFLFVLICWLADGVFVFLLVKIRRWEIRMERALKKKATEHDNLLCFTCGYCLIGASDKCPECGTPFDRKEVVKFWHEWQPRSGVFWNRKKDSLLSNLP